MRRKDIVISSLNGEIREYEAKNRELDAKNKDLVTHLEGFEDLYNQLNAQAEPLSQHTVEATVVVRCPAQ